MNKNLVFLSVLTGIMILLSHCKHDEIVPPAVEDTSTTIIPVYPEPPSNPCDPNTVYFEQQVLKILVSKCAMVGLGCHGEAPYPENLNLTSYEAMKQKEDKLGSSTKLDDYEIWKKITDTDPDEKMPPQGAWQLTAEEKQTIKDWLEQGSPNNRCNSCGDTTFVSFKETIAPMLIENCAGCHNSAVEADKVGNVILFGYPPTLANLDSSQTHILAPAIYRSLNFSSLDPNAAMPRFIGKMYKCDITKFKEWSESLQ